MFSSPQNSEGERPPLLDRRVGFVRAGSILVVIGAIVGAFVGLAFAGDLYMYADDVSPMILYAPILVGSIVGAAVMWLIVQLLRPRSEAGAGAAQRDMLERKAVYGTSDRRVLLGHLAWFLIFTAPFIGLIVGGIIGYANRGDPNAYLSDIEVGIGAVIGLFTGVATSALIGLSWLTIHLLSRDRGGQGSD